MVNKVPDSTYLILVRHGVTDWNNEYRFQGHSDRPLNEEGRAAIPALVSSLSGWQPVAVYTSDLLRAREMADAVGMELAIPVSADEALRECSYGKWEGKKIEEVRAEFSGELEEWEKNEADYPRGGGESLRQMQQRSWARLESIAAEHAGQTVAVFSHSGPIRGAVCRLFDLTIADRYRFQVDNSSLTVLRHSSDRVWQLVLLNQTTHLGEGATAVSPAAAFTP
jgi:broad specificity phosphatase PhoE